MLSVVLSAACLAIAPPLQEAKKPRAARPEAAPPALTVADRVTLRDGKVLLGLVTSPAAGPRVGFDMLVRRDWAQAHVPELAARWIRNAETMRKPALAERRKRLEAWRDERGKAGGDRVATWIDGELKRLDDPNGLDAPLLSVRIARDGCRSAERNSDASRRMLALAWLCGLPDAEDRPPGEVQDAIEGRGFTADGDEVPPLDKLMPIVAEPEAKWLARRAATEVSVDAGRRFLRYNNLLLPDPADGGRPLDAPLDLGSALGEIGKLLDPDAAAVDPLAPALAKIAAKGGAGAVVTRMDMAPDLSRVQVDVALWVRGPQGWVLYGSRNATVRPEEVDPGAAADIGQDPQVQSVFKIAESLGLGAVAGEMRERSLRMGAATARALGQARSAFSQELNGLAFPVLEASPETAPAPPPAGGTPAAPASRPAPRP
ncbi:hypothetical protein [Paludisphaera mucosa]|uniref:Uncharacterized protein n=1 Tax=Paludisphaera mucosa TaxID=3030827 RepID=A0ABT6F9Z4_9BACT|nr:hypothetical protein [Paludisphaera mucosa]MDG3004417.1 hypothetical protein [Paludisphaera mucosa]